MRRLVLCLVICLLVAPERLRPPRDGTPSLVRIAPVAPPPAEPTAPLPTPEEFAALAKSDPLAALHAGVRRYRRQVHGFSAVLEKQERINGRLNPVEALQTWYRNEPHSVLLTWLSEPAGQADRALFVEGTNNNLMLVRPKNRLARALAGTVSRDPDGPEARQGGLVSVRQFGLLKAAERVVTAWDAARKEGRLDVRFVGVEAVPDAGDRPCYLFRRTIHPPADDGLASVLIGLDAETWLQVVNVLTDAEGRTLAAYYFRDVVINPDYPDDVFEPSGLVKK